MRLYDFDYNFLRVVAWHPKLTVTSALLLAGVLSEILMTQEQQYGMLVFNIYQVVLRRFTEELQIEAQVLEFTSRILHAMND